MDSSAETIANNIKVLISNTHGEVLAGVLHDSGSKDIAILCHGFTGTKEFFTLCHLASELAQVGVSSFRFDFSGNGESEGQFEFANYWKEVEDLHSVVQYWVEHGRVVKAVIGHSKGGNVVLLYASKYDEVPIVVNISGRFDLQDGLTERLGENYYQIINENGYLDMKDRAGNIQYRVTKESLIERLNIDMKSTTQSIPDKCRVVTIAGSADKVVPVEDTIQFDKSITNHKLFAIDGADHFYTNHLAELAAIVIGLFTE